MMSMAAPDPHLFPPLLDYSPAMRWWLWRTCASCLPLVHDAVAVGFRSSAARRLPPSRSLCCAPCSPLRCVADMFAAGVMLLRRVWSVDLVCVCAGFVSSLHNCAVCVRAPDVGAGWCAFSGRQSRRSLLAPGSRSCPALAACGIVIKFHLRCFVPCCRGPGDQILPWT